MKTSQVFDALLENLKVGDTASKIADRRDEITKALNKGFRSKESCANHRLMVGSFGRHTAIKGVSDLDLIFVLPEELRSQYSGETGPRRILERVRDILQDRYPKTDIGVDQCVVRVQFTSNAFKFEVQPAFENADGSFNYPDTRAGRWKVTKPRDEIESTKICNDRTSTNMRHLARLARAWKNANGVNMGGLLIDTLAYNFFAQTNAYDSASTASFGFMVRDFFAFLENEPDQKFYLALGSKQQVNVKGRFQPKAKTAHKQCLEAIEKEGESSACKEWRKIFGTSAPLKRTALESSNSFRNTEEFIENKYPIDISATLTIDCEVTQHGWRPMRLREMIRTGQLLRPKKKLDFSITYSSVTEPCELKWKVLNRGAEAERRDHIRGQIIDSNGNGRHTEQTQFRGEHVVECYAIKHGVVVARDRIDVPITDTGHQP